MTKLEAQRVAREWRLGLPEDRVGPFSVSNDQLTLASEDRLREGVSGCGIEYLVGSDIGTATDGASVLLEFQAQEVGLVVRARTMTVVAQPGELQPAQIVTAAGDWWAYWREYWRRRGTDTALTMDHARVVTLPIKRGLAD